MGCWGAVGYGSVERVSMYDAVVFEKGQTSGATPSWIMS